MMKNFVCVLILCELFSFSVFGQQATVDLILFNGKVFTGDPSKPSAEAIAISGDRILAVGSDAEIKKLAGAKTERYDLQGRVVIPGINDAHFHFMPMPKGLNLTFSSIEPSWKETVEALTNAVKKADRGGWIFGTIGGDAMAVHKRIVSPWIASRLITL
jgi:predicted amidohydrolase YtcJ